MGSNYIRRLQLPEAAAEYIRDSIMSGRLAPELYVRIDRVAEELGLSATPVREALHLLRAEGFVELDPNRGFRVASLSREDVSDVFQLLGFVAGELCARTAQKLRQGLIDDLENVQKGIVSASKEKDWETVEELNNQFHRLINSEARSPKLFNFMGLLIHYVPRRFYASIPGWPQASVTDHDSIIEALRQRSPAAAREAMTNHLTHAGALLAANLEARETNLDSGTAS